MGSMRKSRLSQHKQRRLIEHFVAGTTARTAERSRWMRATLAANEKASVVGERLGKSRDLDYLSAAANFIPRLSQMFQAPR